MSYSPLKTDLFFCNIGFVFFFMTLGAFIAEFTEPPTSAAVSARPAGNKKNNTIQLMCKQHNVFRPR